MYGKDDFVKKKVWICLFALALAVNALAWRSSAFCDFYVEKIFPWLGGSYSRITVLFPFSVGEGMIVLAVLFCAALMLVGTLRLVEKIRERAKKRGETAVPAGEMPKAAHRAYEASETAYPAGEMPKAAYRADKASETASPVNEMSGAVPRAALAWTKAAWRWMSRAFCWIGLVFFWIMTLNCFIQYHASAFEDKYMENVREGGYSVEELAALRDFVVENLNELADQIPRDGQGYLVYEGDLYGTAAAAMQRMGEDYGQLKGYYPRPKQIHFSALLSQSYMMGYYFPFSMEANYNKEMYIVNMPYVICHELAHLKGIIQEDEANLIGYLACIQSDDLFFQYSGYMGVLSYVENEFLSAIGRDGKEYKKHPQISQQVREDDLFLTEEAWEKVEEKAVMDTQTVKKVSNAATEATLKINGVEEGMKSYSGVVELLLHYYDGDLF